MKRAEQLIDHLAPNPTRGIESIDTSDTQKKTTAPDSRYGTARGWTGFASLTTPMDQFSSSDQEDPAHRRATTTMKGRAEFQAILKHCRLPAGHTVHIAEDRGPSGRGSGNRLYLQIQTMAPDAFSKDRRPVPQRGRKWFLSPYMTRTLDVSGRLWLCRVASGCLGIPGTFWEHRAYR